MTARTAARAFHQFGNMLLAIAALGFVALPLVEVAKLVL
jgi:hypothetical protein